jgi:hypothetical protein
MGINGNEVSAINEQLRDETLSQSPVGDVLTSGASITGAAIALGASLTTGGPAGLVVAGSVVAGMGIVDWFRKLGTSKVNENLEALGQATEDALNRVEKVLAERGKSVEEIGKRFEGEDLKQAMASASLQALRTADEKRLKRLALILANGVKEGDLAVDSTDHMMRAAVELKSEDVLVLKRIYDQQASILHKLGGRNGPAWGKAVAKSWHEAVTRSRSQRMDETRLHNLDWKSSISRLVSLGFLSPVPADPGGDTVDPHMPYGLLNQGLRFIERLQEIA